MSKQTPRCECCGAKLQPHGHNLSANLVDALIITAKAGGRIHPRRDHRLDKNHYNNYQKLQYWGLARRVREQSTTPNLRGFWELTEDGKAFIGKRLRVHRKVKTLRNEVTGFEGDMVYIHEIVEGYMTIKEYREETQKQLNESQEGLF